MLASSQVVVLLEHVDSVDGFVEHGDLVGELFAALGSSLQEASSAIDLGRQDSNLKVFKKFASSEPGDVHVGSHVAVFDSVNTFHPAFGAESEEAAISKEDQPSLDGEGKDLEDQSL